jgi:hypothetical protein
LPQRLVAWRRAVGRESAGQLFTFKITSEQSEGALTAIEAFVVRPEGPPLHVQDQDELIYTLGGSMRVKLGDTLSEAPAGSFVSHPAREGAHLAEHRLRTAALLRDDHAGGGCVRRVLQTLRAAPIVAAETRAFEVVGPPLAESDPL